MHQENSNTTLVKVKYHLFYQTYYLFYIQIQHLLKLNLSSPPKSAAEAIFKYNTC